MASKRTDTRRWERILEDTVKVGDRNQAFLVLSGGLKPAPKRGDKK